MDHAYQVINVQQMNQSHVNPAITNRIIARLNVSDVLLGLIVPLLLAKIQLSVCQTVAVLPVSTVWKAQVTLASNQSNVELEHSQFRKVSVVNHNVFIVQLESSVTPLVLLMLLTYQTALKGISALVDHL